ncbi:hypothetical protein LIA77_03358 [Sarocladium implicatum]|nr:hypothetical protein LIA77_03358 [Sarocladium implicatum]
MLCTITHTRSLERPDDFCEDPNIKHWIPVRFPRSPAWIVEHLGSIEIEATPVALSLPPGASIRFCLGHHHDQRTVTSALALPSSPRLGIHTQLHTSLRREAV